MSSSRLFLISDDPEIPEPLQLALQKAKVYLDVMTFPSSRIPEARSLATIPPDVFILDTKSWNSDSFGMATLISQLFSQSHMICLDGPDDPERREQLLAAGAKSVVFRPYKPEVLAAAVKSLLLV